MRKRYDAIMEKIEVTEAMRQRILENIGQMRFPGKPHKQLLRFAVLKRTLPLAACFALLLAGILTLRGGILPRPAPGPDDSVESNPPALNLVGDIEEKAGLQALSEAVGFPVRNVTELPFTVEETTYFSLFGELAQIEYSGGAQTALYRQSVGSGDNSGDYTVYAETKMIDAEDKSVTLKGEGGLYTLAIWTDGEYACSLSVSTGLSETEWVKMIRSVK